MTSAVSTHGQLSVLPNSVQCAITIDHKWGGKSGADNDLLPKNGVSSKTF